MPVKIRLARHGKKNKPFYHIVVADSRAPRDGRFIERIGTYNPNMNPAFIELDFDKALNWLQNGAQPTDTCRSILSRQGVMMKKHLLEGAKKNAFSEEEAEVRFQNWLTDKQKAFEAQKEKVEALKNESQKKLFESESKIREERAQAIAKKNAQLASQAEGASIAEPVSEEEVAAKTSIPEPEIEQVAAPSAEEAPTEPEEKPEEPLAEPEEKPEEAAAESEEPAAGTEDPETEEKPEEPLAEPEEKPEEAAAESEKPAAGTEDPETEEKKEAPEAE